MKKKVDQAIKDHAQLLVDLKQVSKAMSDRRTPPLDPLPCKTPVHVWVTESGKIERLRGSHKADGIVMRDTEGYHIFIDENGDPETTKAVGRRASDYFLVYHEYAHIIHGDVFEDDPGRIMKRAPGYQEDRESLANGYAAEKIRPYVSGFAKQAIDDTCVAEGWIGPSTKYYQQLADERD